MRLATSSYRSVPASLGSWLIELGGWPWAFYLNLPLGVLSVWGASRLLKSAPPEGTPARLDVVGLLLLMAVLLDKGRRTFLARRKIVA